MSPYLKGVIVGLAFAVLLGPALFALIQTSIHRGFKSGLFFAIGIFISDLTAIILCYLGASQILGSDPRENFLFGIIGGIILIIFGTVTYTRKVYDKSKENNDKEIKTNTPKLYIYVLKGFFLNIANPGMWFIWVTVIVSIGSNYGINTKSIFAFLFGILSTILGTDILKCFIANKLKQSLKPTVMLWMNRIVGILLIAFGAYLIINVLVDLESMIPFYS
ncbi:MAG: LysE family translocator [Bacteroidales bacterium]|nr:LysE family translocator [Bacteroidales bacterium]